MEIILKYFTDFTREQLRQLEALEGLYKEWNEKINVISRKDIDGLFEKHILHSLSIAAVFEFTGGTRILDLGTGGGFPGIPLAIYFPEVHFHLVDSIGKKLKVVEAIAETIGLKNVTTQHGRAEEIKNKKFEYVVSRAVAPLKDLWSWSKPLIRHKPQGTGHNQPATSNQQPASSDQHPATSTFPPGLICLKGGNLTQEIRESGTRPQLFPVIEIFPEEYFKDKMIVYVPR